MTILFAPLVIRDEVAQALADNRAVVALESTIVVHGLPAPDNLEVAAECDAAVRRAGAVPAAIGLVGGRVVVGLTLDELRELSEPDRAAAKLSARDIGVAMAQRADGATTVAGTIAAAAAAGITVMATGGLGGVHRGAVESFDESADLTALSRTPVIVVASGVKSILDVGATLERLDSLGVPVVGYRTDRFPGFYRRDSGFGVEWRLESPDAVAESFENHAWFSPTGMLVANPVAEADELDAAVHEAALRAALDEVASSGATGKSVTPVMLSRFASQTGGASVRTNRALVVANCALAGEIAVAWAARS